MAGGSINSVVLVGNLTRNAEFKAIPSGYYAINFSIAINKRKKDSSGNWYDEVSYIDIAFFSKSTNLAKYLLKGKQVAVQGELKQDRWEKDGITNSKVRVIANNVQLVGGVSSSNEHTGSSNTNSNKHDNNNNSKFTDDDNIDEDDEIVPF